MPLCIATTVAIGPPTGLRASRVILFAIVTCGVIAALFRGATQFRSGRYNL